ncbi:MAG TPA: hypothetical protein PLW48_10735 [Alphaproteobacteria bacterium]|nr:hypothetical protein [Rhodospirillaceae bacterium]HRJ67601.1 hypothetical protein [Alphaproteobacteria bacterium]
MMMMFFNHLAVLDRQPVPKVELGAGDALWLTAKTGDTVMTPALCKQHLRTQRDMESKVAEMKERGDSIAPRMAAPAPFVSIFNFAEYPAANTPPPLPSA